ncbi:MAG: chemotaxis protein CheW [Betaproteobacteria bacterium]|nr:chemotaxis protein CheW [Betaproteobacteria bacterium]
MMEILDSGRAGDVAEYLSFRLGDEEYGIDILAVREIRAYEKPTRIADAPAYIHGVINLRGLIVPIVDLRVKFGLAAAQYNELTAVIILKVSACVIGIVVDSVSDVLPLKHEQIRAVPDFGGRAETSFIRGLAMLQGRMLILMDIAGLMTDPHVLPVETVSVGRTSLPGARAPDAAFAARSSFPH